MPTRSTRWFETHAIWNIFSRPLLLDFLDIHVVLIVADSLQVLVVEGLQVLRVIIGTV